MAITIADRLREIRQNKNLRQSQVAKQLGVERCTISAYESGARQPSIDMLISLSRLYHVSVDYLLGLTGANTIDLSGLSFEEMTVVTELVHVLKKR